MIEIQTSPVRSILEAIRTDLRDNFELDSNQVGYHEYEKGGLAAGAALTSAPKVPRKVLNHYNVEELAEYEIGITVKARHRDTATVLARAFDLLHAMRKFFNHRRLVPEFENTENRYYDTQADITLFSDKAESGDKAEGSEGYMVSRGTIVLACKVFERIAPGT